MENFYNLTIRQLEAKAREVDNLTSNINLLVEAIFTIKAIVRNENYSDENKNKRKIEWQNAINLDLRGKFKLIESFIRDEYPEKKLKDINREKAEFKKYVLEREKEIAEAFEVLAQREEKINNEIKNHLNKNNRKTIKTK
jgi:hypothetical protein